MNTQNDIFIAVILGCAAVICLVAALIYLTGLATKPAQPPSAIDEMADYLENISLPWWSNGSTRNWLENQLQIWKKTRKNSRGAHTDAQLLVHLFLELGRHDEEANGNPKATVDVPILINFEGCFSGEYCYRAICPALDYVGEYGESAGEAYDLAVSSILATRKPNDE